MARVLQVGAFAALTVMSAPLGAQMIAIDGSTETMVSGSDGLGFEVGIAPSSDDGVSLNGFERFSVPSSGVVFDNRSERARTIVAEVSGSDLSGIYGQVEIAGAPSHFILANPNGILVDGGSFVNVGQLVLGAGEMSSREVVIAPGVTRVNPVLTTSSAGVVRIEGAGLSGEMDALHVLASRIEVEGPVSVESPISGSFARFAAGQSETEFNSAIIAGNLDQQFAETVALDQSYEGVAFTLGSAGGINAGRIEVLVSDRGAGVQVSGEALSSTDGILISADGTIGMRDARLRARRDVVVRGREIRAERAVIEAEGGLELIAESVSGGGISLSGGAVFGASVVFDSASTFRLGEAANLRAEIGSVQLRSDGNAVLDGITLSAADSVLVDVAGELALLSSSLDGLALVFSAGDTLSMEGGRIEAFALADFSAPALRFSATDPESGVRVAAGALALTADAGDIANEGMRLEGAQALPEEGYAWAVDVTAAGSYLARSDSSDALAILFGVNGPVSVTAEGGDIRLENARILANSDVRLQAAEEVWLGIDLPNGTALPAEHLAEGRDPLAWSLNLLSARERGVGLDYGTLNWPGQDALVVSSGGSVEIASQALTVQGGSVIGNPGADNAGGDVVIEVANLAVAPVLSGSIAVDRRCVVFCRFSVSGPGVAVTGGEISAVGDMRVTASEAVQLSGGQLFALGDVTVQAPDISVEAVGVPGLVERPTGLWNLWGGDGRQLYSEHRLGAILSGTGTVDLESDSPVQLIGGRVEGVIATEFSAGSEIVARRGSQYLMADDQLGWFAYWPWVGD